MVKKTNTILCRSSAPSEPAAPTPRRELCSPIAITPKDRSIMFNLAVYCMLHTCTRHHARSRLALLAGTPSNRALNWREPPSGLLVRRAKGSHAWPRTSWGTKADLCTSMHRGSSPRGVGSHLFSSPDTQMRRALRPCLLHTSSPLLTALRSGMTASLCQRVSSAAARHADTACVWLGGHSRVSQ